MKTIEERSFDYGHYLRDMGVEKSIADNSMIDYRKGAADQQRIEAEKRDKIASDFLEWFKVISELAAREEITASNMASQIRDYWARFRSS